MNDRFDAPTYVIGGVLSGASLTTALVSSQLGRLTGRFSEKTLLRCAFLLYAAGLTLVAVTPTLLLIPLVLFGVVQGINPPNVFSLFNAHAPNENRGAFMATNGMALRTGQTVGPLLMASLAGTLGATGAYLATAIIALVASLLAFVAVR
jgi:MFS family permease